MYTVYNTKLYICLEALCTYRTPQTWQGEVGKMDRATEFSRVCSFSYTLRRATVYGFYEAEAHITMAPVNHKQSTYLLLGSLILGKVKYKW